jgi:hypothetical protein
MTTTPPYPLRRPGPTSAEAVLPSLGAHLFVSLPVLNPMAVGGSVRRCVPEPRRPCARGGAARAAPGLDAGVCQRPDGGALRLRSPYCWSRYGAVIPSPDQGWAAASASLRPGILIPAVRWSPGRLRSDAWRSSPQRTPPDTDPISTAAASRAPGGRDTPEILRVAPRVETPPISPSRAPRVGTPRNQGAARSRAFRRESAGRPGQMAGPPVASIRRSRNAL